MKPSQGFWGTWGNGIYYRRTGEQRPNFEGNREHKKHISTFGVQGNTPIYSRGTREQVPLPLGGPHKLVTTFSGMHSV